MEDDAARWQRLVAALTELGAPDSDGECWYRSLGFKPSDIPALVELARKWAELDDLELVDHDPAFASLHAWAAIAELGDPVIVRVVLEQFPRLRAQEDHRFVDEFCHACAVLGGAVVGELRGHVLDRRHSVELRSLLVDGLTWAGASDDARDEVVEIFARGLREAREDERGLNACFVDGLAQLGAVEHAELIAGVLREGIVDTECCGGWEEVARQLGLGTRGAAN